jgi:enterochelin esterase-like enzyme
MKLQTTYAALGVALCVAVRARSARAQCSNLPPGAENQTFESTYMGGNWPYVIYLPPGYAKSDRRFPAVYWFHGRGDSQCNQAPLAADIQSAIESGLAAPMIYVFLNGGAQCNFADGACPGKATESYIMKELIPYIDAHYRTIAAPNGRAIEGWSMGAAAVLKYFYKYTDQFCDTVAIAAGGDSPTSVDQQAEDKIRARGNPAIRIVVGTADAGHLGACRAQVKMLESDGILHEYEEVTGIDHNPFGVYRATNGMTTTVGQRNLGFHSKCFARFSDMDGGAPADATVGDGSAIDARSLDDSGGDGASGSGGAMGAAGGSAGATGDDVRSGTGGGGAGAPAGSHGDVDSTNGCACSAVGRATPSRGLGAWLACVGVAFANLRRQKRGSRSACQPLSPPADGRLTGDHARVCVSIR